MTEIPASATVASDDPAFVPPSGTNPARRGRWWRILLFPVTVRKFERVFHATGEPLLPRWKAAFKWALVTIRS